MNLLEGVDHRLLLAHHERDAGAGLGQNVDQQAVGLLQRPDEGLVVTGDQRCRIFEKLLARAVALAPAVHGSDHILAGHRRAVVELEPVAQSELIHLAVFADGPLVDHLRLRVELGIAGEERVVDHQPVDAGDGLRRPERVERADIRMHGDTQRLGLLRRRRHGHRHRCQHGEGRREPELKCCFARHHRPSVLIAVVVAEDQPRSRVRVEQPDRTVDPHVFELMVGAAQGRVAAAKGYWFRSPSSRQTNSYHPPRGRNADRTRQQVKYWQLRQFGARPLGSDLCRNLRSSDVA